MKTAPRAPSDTGAVNNFLRDISDDTTTLVSINQEESPVDARFPLQLASVTEEQDTQLRWRGHAGVRYQAEQRNSLSAGLGWSALGGALSGYEGPMQFPISGEAGSTFYRLTVLP